MIIIPLNRRIRDPYVRMVWTGRSVISISIPISKAATSYITQSCQESTPKCFSKVMPIVQPNRDLETVVSKEVSYLLYSAQLLHRRRPNAVRLWQ